MEPYKLLVLVHGLAGVVALLTYWAAALARKGSPLHRAVGRSYLLSMIAIVATALPMAVIFVLRGKPGIATFLGYVVVLTATAMWLGWRAIRRKRDQRAYRDRMYAVVAVANIASALIVLAVGLRMEQALLMGFSVIGLLNGVPMLQRYRKPMTDANWWLQEHYNAMVACGAATHVAFLSIGLNRLVQSAGFTPPSWYGLIGWFVPVLASIAAAAWLDRRHRPKPRLAAA